MTPSWTAETRLAESGAARVSNTMLNARASSAGIEACEGTEVGNACGEIVGSLQGVDRKAAIFSMTFG